MNNTGAAKELVVKKPDDTWQSFQIPYSIVSARKMVFDKEGRLWMCQRAGNIIVYEPGENLDAPQAGTNVVSLGTGSGNGGLPNNNVWCMAEDKNGDMWVGTDEGIGVFYCASNVLSQTNRCDADRIKVERDGFIGYLFATEIVKAIAVDGANRKWVGTTNGVWLITDDGKTELLRFTKDNSPLPSNFITDIRINQQTGEVFIGTENGLVSYMGDATLGEATKGTALVYPNPVKSSYQGVIAIKGLVDNAYVKITDVSGTLVFQGRANGGQMVWDGNGYNGVRVKTGVYMVYAATDLGKERNVAKIVLEN
jgi:ligand-binding sensor domain-containing protein